MKVPLLCYSIMEYIGCPKPPEMLHYTIIKFNSGGRRKCDSTKLYNKMAPCEMETECVVWICCVWCDWLRVCGECVCGVCLCVVCAVACQLVCVWCMNSHYCIEHCMCGNTVVDAGASVCDCWLEDSDKSLVISMGTCVGVCRLYVCVLCVCSLYLCDVCHFMI